MDRQLLAALDNLSEALYQISEALDKKDAKTATGDALQSGEFGKQIQEIHSGIISLKEDTAKILDNQETILKILNSKKKEETKKVTKLPKGETSVEVGKEKEKDEKEEEKKKGLGFDTSKIKEGVGTLILMAAGIVAIGLALKIVGNVNFVSVLSLALALPLIAIAFERIAKIDVDSKKIPSIILMMVGFSTAIALSSYILGMVKPIGIIQATTAILIAGAFSVMSFGLGKLVAGFNKINPVEALTAAKFIPQLLIAVSLAIVGASLAFRLIQPIGLLQALTAILIAGVFTVLSFGIGKIISAFKGIDPETAFSATTIMPIVFVALSLSIATSSWLLSMVMPIGIFQALTAILIAATFVVLSFSLSKIIPAFKGFDKGDVTRYAFTIPLIFTAMSLAIMLSSHILVLTESIKFSKLLEILALGATIAIVSLLLTPAIILLGKQDKKALVQGGIAVAIISIAIMIASHVLAVGNYEKYPGKDWIMGTSISILVFGLATVGLGFAIMASGGLGFAGIALGAVAVVMVAATILATSYILAEGSYEKFPPIDWILGVAASLIPFALASVVLAPLLPFVALGALSIYLVSKTIVKTAKILSEGNYEKYPSFDWSTGVGLSLAAFSAGMVMLGGIIFGTFGVGGALLAAGALAVLGVAGTIVATSDILANGYEIGGKRFTPNWKGGPTKEWAESVAIALGAFSPLYSMLQKNAIFSLFGMGGVGPEDYAKAIKTVTEGIVTAASELNKGDATWKGGPTKDWAEGVSLALGAFSPIYEILTANSGWWKSGVSVEDFSKAIKTISQGIIEAANFFSSDQAVTSFKNPPPEEWARGVGKAISAFSPVYEVLANSKGIFSSGPSVGEMRRAVITISNSIIEAAGIFGDNVASFDPNKAPSVEWSKGVSKSIEAFAPVFDYLSNNSGWFGADVDDLNEAIVTIAHSIVSVSNTLKDGDYSYEISTDWIKTIDTLYQNYINIFNKISKIKNKELDNGNSLILDIAFNILRIDFILAKGKYSKYPSNEWIDTTNSIIIKFADLLIKMNDEYPIDDLVGGVQKTVLILALINRVDRTFERGKYGKYPDKNWIDNSKSSVEEIAQLAAYINSEYSVLDLWLGLRKVRNIADTIQYVSLSLNKGNYSKYPSVDWAKGSALAISEFMNLDLGNVFTQAFDFLFGSGDEDKKAELGKIADLMLYVDEKFQKGNWNNFPTVSWAEGTIMAIQKFRSIVNMLSFASIGDKVLSFFGAKDPLKEAVSNIEMLAKSFDKLGKSFQSFSNSLEGLDAEKLAAIRTLSSNVILMSLMDSDQFDKMMDALEERSGVFGELIKEIDSKRESSGAGSVSFAASTASPQDNTKILADKLDVVTSLLADITSVVGSRGSLKKYLASIKDEVSIGQNERR